MTKHTTVDFQTIQYPPEAIPEAFVVGTVPVGSVSVAKYDQFTPLYLQIQDLGVVTGGEEVETAVIIDGRGDVSRILSSGALYSEKYSSPIRFRAAHALELLQTSKEGSSVSDVATRFTVTAFAPTILDKIRMNIGLTPAESDLAREFDLADKINAGARIPQLDLTGPSILTEFDQIKQISKSISVGAGKDKFVETTLLPPRGYLGVLLGIAVDGGDVRDNMDPRDTYVNVDRDGQPTLSSLDTYALPGMGSGEPDEFMRMYIPFVDRLDVRLTSVTGVSDFPISYFYGFRRLNYVDRAIRWPQVGFKDNDARERAEDVISKYNLRKLVAAGLPIE